ncbi:MAG TPA: hypothetical protein VF516_26580 [Kofleriaceae bacterium]
MARALGIVIATSLAVFVLVNFVLQHTPHSIPNVAFAAELTNVVSRATHPWMVKDLISLLRNFPGVLPTAGFPPPARSCSCVAMSGHSRSSWCAWRSCCSSPG